MITAGATALVGYWVAVTAPVLAGGAPSADAAPSDRPAAAAALVTPTTQEGGPIVDALGRVEWSLGCAEGTSAADLDAFFAQRRGPLLGWDNPHVYELGPDRWLWLIHDTYLDHRWAQRPDAAVGLLDDGPQIQNAAMVQEGACFTLLHRGTPDRRRNFEPGAGQDGPDRFLWPLGGEVHDGRLLVLWSEMERSSPPPRPGNGIVRHPVRTWLAEYDPTTLERRRFEPAPNDGVDPIWGFAVASDDEATYLFGNTNLLNFDREGGWWEGPHSATRMYVAKVDRGRLDQVPTYWDGEGWSGDPADAAVVSERFWTENTMQPRHVDGRWLSIVKEDGFDGDELWLETAEDPWGPWTVVERRPYAARPADVATNTYQPIVLPRSSPDTGVQVVVSQNAVTWRDAVAVPARYRPGATSFEWPGDGASGGDQR